MMKYWKFFGVFCLVLTAGLVIAQEDTERAPWKDRLVLGGNAGFNVNNGIMVIEAAPLVGYRVTDRFTAGTQISYTYYRFKTSPSNVFTTSFYSGSVFTRYFPLDQLFLHQEFERLNLEYWDNTGMPPGYTRGWISRWLVGAGYRQPIGERSALMFMVLWDVIDDDLSPYTNPIIRGGLVFGI